MTLHELLHSIQAGIADGKRSAIASAGELAEQYRSEVLLRHLLPRVPQAVTTKVRLPFTLLAFRSSGDADPEEDARRYLTRLAVEQAELVGRTLDGLRAAHPDRAEGGPEPHRLAYRGLECALLKYYVAHYQAVAACAEPSVQGPILADLASIIDRTASEAFIDDGEMLSWRTVERSRVLSTISEGVSRAGTYVANALDSVTADIEVDADRIRQVAPAQVSTLTAAFGEP